MDFNKLKEPFDIKDIEFRIGRCGTTNGKVWATTLAYVQARAIMNRLDDVVGPENWKAEYSFVGNNGVMCKLSVKAGNEWISKEDGAEQTEIESFKGGISGALKRAAVLWGIGRYLYALEEGFAQIVEKGTKGSHYAKTKEGAVFYWLPPALPAWALPAGAKADEPLRIEQPTSIKQAPTWINDKIDVGVPGGPIRGKTYYELGSGGLHDAIQKINDLFTKMNKPIPYEWNEFISKAKPVIEYLEQ